MAILIDTDVRIPTQDGVLLASTILRPEGGGARPVILMRTPYDRSTYSSVSLQVHAISLASSGYAVVLQDVRGRGASDGFFTPFVNEQADGVDTVEWLLERSWCDGSIGLAGISYNAFTQTAIAAANHPAVKCWVPGLASSDVRTSWIRRGGVLDLGFHLSWGLGSIAPLDGRTDDPESVLAAYDTPIATAARGSADQPELSGTPAGQWFFDWAANADPYPNHPEVPGRTEISRITAPALVVAGWFDVFSSGSIELLSWLREGPTGSGHRLVGGPWDHSGLPLGRRAGDRDFGRQAIVDLHQLQLAWFDQHLRDGDEVEVDQYFVTGSNQWHEGHWPPASRMVDMPLGAGGLEPAGQVGASNVTVDVTDPTPLLGGTSFPWDPDLRCGAFDQRDREARPDVISFVGKPLEEPVEIGGSPIAVLPVAGPSLTTPAHITLVEVTPEGPVWNIADGMGQVDVSSGLARVEMGPVAHRFSQGSAIGIDVAFSAGARIGPVVPGSRVIDLSSQSGQLSLPLVM